MYGVGGKLLGGIKRTIRSLVNARDLKLEYASLA